VNILKVGILFGVAQVCAFYAIEWIQAGFPPFITWITDSPNESPRCSPRQAQA
jgi:hypothetical protein